MNDYKDKYSIYSDNSLRDTEYKIKNNVSITENDIKDFCTAKGIPIELLIHELLDRFNINKIE
jgi:hypothetical protein